MKLNFTKMHGLGNDFVVIDAISQEVTLTPQQLRKIADRHHGIGCDQILLVEHSADPDADFHYRIFNADGTEAEQCGNGARCFARFVYDQSLTRKKSITVTTKTTPLSLHLRDDGTVSVNMGNARFSPRDIPFNCATSQQQPPYTLTIGDKQVNFYLVSMGNPHAVIIVDDVTTAPVGTIGPLVENHPCFPNRVNVGFLEVVDRHHLKLRVHERGAGETLACGSGACAAVAAARTAGLIDQDVTVTLPGGALQFHYPGRDSDIVMTGPVAYVFEGTIEL